MSTDTKVGKSICCNAPSFTSIGFTGRRKICNSCGKPFTPAPKSEEVHPYIKVGGKLTNTGTININVLEEDTKSEELVNQCDGCMSGLPISSGIHYKKNGSTRIVDSYCQKDRYIPQPLSTREELKHKLFGIVAKLDNGSHSANQLQGIDESFTKLIDNVLAQSREDTLAEVRDRLPKEIEKKINSAGGIGGTKHLNGMIDDILSTLTNLKEEKR